MPSFTLETEANGQSTQVGDPLPSLAAAVENAIQQFEFDATQARLAARFLRLAAATVDPDPVEV